MPEHEVIEIRESATVQREDAPACDAAGPFRGHRCTEPAGHAGDHQHHADGARAAWAGEG